MVQYKCVPGPKKLVVNSPNDMDQAVGLFADLINQHCVDGWDFFALEDIVVTSRPGCLAGLWGAKETTTLYNMLIFKRQDPDPDTFASKKLSFSTEPSISSGPFHRFQLVIGSSVYPLSPGSHLSPDQVQSLQPQPGQLHIAAVLKNSQNPAQVGLQNLSTAPWQVKAPQGSPKMIQPGQVLRLLNGLLIQFSDTDQGEIIEGSEL